MSVVLRPALALSTLSLLATLAACGGRQAEPAADAAGAQAPAPAAGAAVTEAPASAAAAIEPAPTNAVEEVMARFKAARSYHVTMDTRSDQGPMTIEMDFVAPDRYRMSTPVGTQYVIGDTMYMSAQGRTMKIPMTPGQMSQFRDSARFAEHRETMTVEAQGSETIDGQDTRKYLVRNTQPEPSESTMWVGSDGLPVQVEVKGNAAGKATATRIRYSRFNDPTITIEPPK